MVNGLLFLLLFLPAVLIAGRKTRPEELTDELNAIYTSIKTEYKDNLPEQIKILENAGTPHLETLFEDYVFKQPADDKTALLLHLLDEHYVSLNKKKMAPKIAEWFHQDFKSINEEKKRKILDDLLRTYDEKKREEIIKKLIETKTNAVMLQGEINCDDVRKNGNPTYVGITPLVDELNNAHFIGFVNPTMKNTILNRGQFNEFNSFNQWGLWIQPFGFYTHFTQEPKPLKFNFYTVGLSVGGDYTFFERLVLGLGAAYSHSGITFKEQNKDASLNTLYFGPSLSYIFPNGYLSYTLYGVANFYHLTRNVTLFKEVKETLTDIEYTNWDLVSRLEGGLSFHLGGEVYFQPTARIDYLHVFQPSCTEELEENVEITTESLNASYLTSKLGIALTREFYSKNQGFLIPTLSAGCYFFNPLKNDKYQYEIPKCKPETEESYSEKVKITGWRQYFVGAGLSYVHKKGLLISLNYEYALGTIAPTQEGDIRIELSW